MNRKYINAVYCRGRRKIMSHLLCDDRGEGGYLKKVTLDDIGGWGSEGPLKKVTSLKYSPLYARNGHK